MSKKREEMIKGFKEIQAERIGIYPVGVDSADRALAYIVRGDQIWFAKDDALTAVDLPQEEL